MGRVHEGLPLREFHFTIHELEKSSIADARGIKNIIPAELRHNADITMAGCERIRALLDHPMTILSGYRCPELNASVQGSESSQHTRAQAVDFVCHGYGPIEKIAKTLAKNMDILGVDQLILEPGWIHVSFTVTPRLEVLHVASDGRYIPGLA